MGGVIKCLVFRLFKPSMTLFPNTIVLTALLSYILLKKDNHSLSYFGKV